MPDEIDFSSLPVFEWERSYLERGRLYRVIKDFSDDDGVHHPVGEEWTFLGSTYSRYDGLRILGVRMPSGQVTQLTLRDSKQREVLHDFDQYVALA